jgi:hypothetical protein
MSSQRLSGIMINTTDGIRISRIYCPALLCQHINSCLGTLKMVL